MKRYQLTVQERKALRKLCRQTGIDVDSESFHTKEDYSRCLGFLYSERDLPKKIAVARRRMGKSPFYFFDDRGKRGKHDLWELVEVLVDAKLRLVLTIRGIKRALSKRTRHFPAKVTKR